MINLYRLCKQMAVAMVVAVGFMGSLGWAADGALPINRHIVAEEGQKYQPKDRVSIKTKMIDGVVTNIGDTYVVDQETIIVGLDGKQVSIRKMLVPCETEITYDTRNGKRIARRIQITRIHDNAKWQWISRQAE